MLFRIDFHIDFLRSYLPLKRCKTEDVVSYAGSNVCIDFSIKARDLTLIMIRSHLLGLRLLEVARKSVRVEL